MTCDRSVVFSWYSGFLLVLWFPPGTLVFSCYSGFLLVLWFPPHHDITEILLKVTLNTISLTINMIHWYWQTFIQKYFFSILWDLPPFLAHLAFGPGELLSSLFVCRLSSVVRRPSVNISHFNFLLRKHWTNCNQTLVEWSLDGPFQNCVRWSRLPTKMATKLKIEKRGDEILIVHCCFSVSQNELKF